MPEINAQLQPGGASVNNIGCPQWEKVLNHQESILHFSRDSSDTNNTEAHKALEKIARTARDFPQATIILTGYASQPASEAYNLKLSQKRAEHVHQQLTRNFGLSSNRIKVRWHGEKKPVKQGLSPEANQVNRRVTALIIYEQSRSLKKWSAQTFPQPVFQ